ncbi:Protein CBG07823 [Caenorhabditis briggsae]|uniref:Protein CBG07823 n=1 Tax=Caenorhabditis briggsae TaxID=6238 RepID=A8X582_CAEBR|nr:Protein CBG07823 [Caenorhabditis briggsae]CAP27781.2 Protein CBG07823 [Caenorhabditis briggsae]
MENQMMPNNAPIPALVEIQDNTQMDIQVLLHNALLPAFDAVLKDNARQHQADLYQKRLHGQVLLASGVLVQQVAHAAMGRGQYGPHINNLHTDILLVQHAGEGLNLLAPVLPQLTAPILPQLPVASEDVNTTSQTVSESYTAATQTNESGQLCEGSSQTHQELEFVVHETFNLEPTDDKSSPTVEGENSGQRILLVPEIEDGSESLPAERRELTLSVNSSTSDGSSSQPESPVGAEEKEPEEAEPTSEVVAAPTGSSQDLAMDPLDIDAEIVQAETQPTSAEPASPAEDVVDATVAAAPIDAKDASNKGTGDRLEVEEGRCSPTFVIKCGSSRKKSSSSDCSEKHGRWNQNFGGRANLPKTRVGKGYARRGRPSNKNRTAGLAQPAANVDDAAPASSNPADDVRLDAAPSNAVVAPAALNPVNAAPSVDAAPVGRAPVDAPLAAVVAPVAHAAMNGSSGNGAPKRIRPVNGAPETTQVMRRAARKAIKQKKPLVEGTEAYHLLLQEANAHHAVCPIYRDQELGQLTNLNLFNPNKRSKALPQEVCSKTKMAKDLFHNYLKVMKIVKTRRELEKAWSSLSPADRQKWLDHETAVFDEHLEQLRRGFIRTPGSRSGRGEAAGEMDEDEDVAGGADEDAGAAAAADEMVDEDEPAVKRARADY